MGVRERKNLYRPIKTNHDIMKKRKEYIFMWSLFPIIPSHWATPQALKERSEIFTRGEYFGYYGGKVITAYMPREQLERWKKTTSKQYLKPSYFRKYQQQYQKEKSNWWKWIREIEKKDYSNVEKKQLKKDHWKFQEYMRDAIAYFGSTRSEFTYQVEQKLEKIIKKYSGNDSGCTDASWRRRTDDEIKHRISEFLSAVPCLNYSFLA